MRYNEMTLMSKVFDWWLKEGQTYAYSTHYLRVHLLTDTQHELYKI